MRVRQFNTDLKGGAATAAKRLHLSLLKNRIDSRFHYHPDYHDESAIPDRQDTFQSLAPCEPTGIAKWIERRETKSKRNRNYRKHFANRPKDREIFSTPWQRGWTPCGKNDACEIVHLHWILSWLDLSTFLRSFPKKQPIVWTLHDMNTITGGCHHSDECEKFKTVCQSCIQIDNPGIRDISRKVFDYKKKLFKHRNIHFVTPSKWMENNVRESSLGQYATTIRTIRNGLDLTLFQPFEKNDSRHELAIPTTQPVIGFGAASLSNNRKGFQDLLKALQLLANDMPTTEITVLVFGVDDLQIPPIPGIKFLSLGYLSTPIQQQKAYSAMDLFVLPSWAENMPQTAVEAMACGTPVLAYDIGGVPEIVIPNQTGLLAKHRDPVDLANKIRNAIGQSERMTDWGKNGRRLIEKQFSLQESHNQYMELYRSVV